MNISKPDRVWFKLSEYPHVETTSLAVDKCVLFSGKCFFRPGTTQRSDYRRIAGSVRQNEQRIFFDVESSLVSEERAHTNAVGVTENAGLFNKVLAFEPNHPCVCSVYSTNDKRVEVLKLPKLNGISVPRGISAQDCLRVAFSQRMFSACSRNATYVF